MPGNNFKHRHTDQWSREPTNKLIQLQSPHVWQTCRRHTSEKDSFINKYFWKTGFLSVNEWNLIYILSCTKSIQNGSIKNGYYKTQNFGLSRGSISYKCLVQDTSSFRLRKAFHE